MKSTKNTTLAVCCLARDCAKNLQKNIPRLESLIKYFQRVEFFIVENHSHDNTRQVLEHWKNVAPYHIHLPDVDAYHRTVDRIDFNFYDQDQAIIDSMYDDYKDKLAVLYKDRVSRISLARDCYLDAIQKSDFTPDYIVMCDIDIQNFSTKGILSCFSSDVDWDVATANGGMYHMTKTGMDYLYYDTFALEIEGKEIKAHHIKDYLRDEVQPLLNKKEWIHVLSAFGGIAIYSYDSIFSSPPSYYIDAIIDDNFLFCEHVSFHRLLRKKNFKNIYINPQFAVHYNTRMQTIIDKIKKYFEKDKE